MPTRRPTPAAALPEKRVKAKLAIKIRSPFQEALNRHMEQGTVPSGVGWLLNRTKKLLLLSDLHSGPTAAHAGSAAGSPVPTRDAAPRVAPAESPSPLAP